MLRRDAFVPEVAIDLEHPLHAADRQPLQIQLGRDPQEELHVERVVVRHERPRQRAAGNRLHHRRLDFQEAVPLQKIANRSDRGGANLEHPPHLGVDDHVEITLAIANLDVLQAMPLLGQRQETLCEEFELCRPDRQLVGLGAKQVSGHADLIAKVEQLRQRVIALAQGVLADVDLEARAAVGDHDEAGLAKVADADDPPGRDGLDPRRLELGGRGRGVGVDQLRHRVRGIELIRVRGETKAGDRVEVRMALFGLDHFVTHSTTSPSSLRRRYAPSSTPLTNFAASSPL